MNRFDSDLLDQLVDFMLAPEGYPERLHRLKFPVTTGGTVTANISALSETGQMLAARALMGWTEATGLRFALVESEDAQIMFSDTGSSAESGARHKDGVLISSTVNIPAASVNESEGRITTFAFDALLHEIGHALGLHHPGHYPRFGHAYGEDNVFTNDSYQTTAMSYFSQLDNTDLDASWASVVTPMIADIIALHDLYGTPVLRAGDTVYGVGSNLGGHLGLLLGDLAAGNLASSVTFTLFDSGGTDTLNLSTDTDDQHVVLQPETASDVYGLVGNLVIARDTLIENYVAGSGDDIIVGNSADNVLEGNAGADNIDGQAGLDTAAYTGSSTAVTVNLSDGTASGGDAEGDTLTSIENLTGSAHDDTLTGDAVPNVLDGRAGADTLAGGDGTDTASYTASDTAITIDLSTGANSGGHAEGDTLSGIEHLLGSRYADVLTGDAGPNRLDGGGGNDRLEGRAGADTLAGGTGVDTASYAASAAAVTVNLETGAASGGDAEGDTLDSIEHLTGSAHDDTLIGDAGPNVLEGGGGGDMLDGGDGIDTASYAGSASRVDVRLSGTVVNFGDATGDTLTNIENLIGSAHNDTVVGNGQANALTGLNGNDLLWGSSGDDLLTGGPGADRLVGGAGNDTASFAGSPEGVTVRLHSFAAANGDAQGDSFPYTVDVAYTDAGGLEQTETLPDVESLIGSAHNDILAGDRRDNDLDGGAGDDTLYGGPGGGDDNMAGGLGNDRLFGGQGNDILIGGQGDDRLAGGAGADVFVFGSGDGADTVTDFSAGTDKLDLTAFEIEDIEDVTMTTGDDGVTIDLTDVDGGSILLAGLTTLPETGDFLV